MLALVLLGGSAAAQDGRPPALREVGFDQRLGETVPLDIELRDEAGRSVRLGDYFGRKPVVLALVYYDCPMLCTLTLNGLASALAVLPFDAGREFEIVTVSFEPRETPALAAAKKQAYLRRYQRPGAALGWHFLTGEPESTRRLTEAVGFRYAWDEQTKQYAHPSGILVLTPDGRIARYLYGIEYAPKDLRFALMEASQRRIGSAMDQAVLYCYRYDPMTGRYAAVVMRLVRAGGVLTVLALVSFWAAMWRREHAGPRSQPEGRGQGRPIGDRPSDQQPLARSECPEGMLSSVSPRTPQP
jgi:protein SCO1/2